LELRWLAVVFAGGLLSIYGFDTKMDLSALTISRRMAQHPTEVAAGRAKHVHMADSHGTKALVARQVRRTSALSAPA
jgi:hypothetical protein